MIFVIGETLPDGRERALDVANSWPEACEKYHDKVRWAGWIAHLPRKER